MQALIIGGGIGGLTAAIALRRRGIDAEVYERAAVLQEVGAGISLWPNAVKALRKLGIGDLLDSISFLNDEGALRSWNGTFLSHTVVREMERRLGGNALLLHRAELLDVLGRTVGSAHIHLGHLCVGIGQDSTGVMARFGNGATARGDILIGADGLHSVVRAGLGLRDKIRYSGYTAWRAVVPFDASKVVPGETWGRGRRFGAMPIHNGRVYWYATNNTPEGGQDRAKAALLSLFKGWHEPIEALIRATDESMILRNDIYDRDPVPAWGRGRITLLGDAAHPMTPNLGQGACQAIEDALVLATRLTSATTPEAGLRDYELRRIPRTSRIVMASRRVGALGQVESAFLCSLRDTLVRLTPSSVTYRSVMPVAGYEDHLQD